jgi:excisionase family DNA binding protein
MEQKLLTVNEAAERLKVNPQSVYRWIEAGKLKAFKIQGIVRITEEQLDNFIKAG